MYGGGRAFGRRHRPMSARLVLYRGKWCATWNDGETTRRHSFRTGDRKDAERQFRDFRIADEANTVAAAVTRYLEEKKGRARSHEAMRASWKALEPVCGHLRPDQIDVTFCREFAERRRAQGRADGTIIKDLSFLRAALKWAKKPGASFEMPEAPPPRDRVLTRDEYLRLLDACKGPHIRLFVILALTTAGRASAVLELTWDRVDFEKGRINLSANEGRRKGRAAPPMNKRAREALEAAHARRSGNRVIEYAGEPVRSIKKAFRYAARRAGLHDVTPHVLRHTAAVWMIEAGIPLEEVAQFLGHTDIKVTYRVYARYRPEHLRKAAAALEF